MKNIVLKTIGVVALFMGVLGAVLPLLPSTCFILLAAWAFSKSSPTFHAWLAYRSPFASAIHNWQQHRIIPRKVKWMASLSIMTSFALTAWLVSNPVVIACLAIGMGLLLTYLLTRDSEAQVTMVGQIN